MTILIKPPHRVRKRKKSIEAQAVLDKLQAYLDGSVEVPVEMLCGFWKDQQEAITYQEIRETVKAGVLDEATFQEWARDYSILVARKLEPVWESAMAAGAACQPLLSGTSFTFNTQTPGIMQWISRRGAAFVTSCSVEQKKAISSLLAQKVVESHTVDELARLIRPCIGLTDGQSKATLRYYDNIAASLRENHPRMKPERIQQKATDAAIKYAERQHRQRAFTIAQTEMAFAYNRGADEGIRQAQAQNLLGVVEKRWSTSGDENVCGTCDALDGVQIGMEDGFGFVRRELFEGQNLLPPAHPRCACAVMYIEVEKPESIAEASNMDTYQEERDNQQLFENLDYYRHRYQESEGIYETYNNGSNDVIKPRNIRKNMQKSNVGREMLEYLEKNNISVKLLYGVDNPGGCYGFYDPIDDVIRIFVDKTVTVEKTAEVIIHETAHRKYDIGDDQWSEAVCIAQEVKHKNRRNTLTAKEKRDIIKLTKELYPDFSWRKV